MRGEDRRQCVGGDGCKEEGGVWACRLQYSRGAEEVVSGEGRERGRMGQVGMGAEKWKGRGQEWTGEGRVVRFARAEHYDWED
jgi:hypothetical protein